MVRFEVYSDLSELMGALDEKFQLSGNNPLEDHLDEVEFQLPDGATVTEWRVYDKDGKMVIVPYGQRRKK